MQLCYPVNPLCSFRFKNQLGKTVTQRTHRLREHSRMRDKLIVSLQKFYPIWKNRQLRKKSAILIQRSWRDYLDRRYKYLGLNNLDDLDAITLQDIKLIPKTDIFIWYQAGKARAGNIFVLMEWIANQNFLTVPINPYTQTPMGKEEIEWVIDRTIDVLKFKCMKEEKKTTWLKLIDDAIEVQKDRCDPLRVINRLKNQQNRAMLPWTKKYHELQLTVIYGFINVNFSDWLSVIRQIGEEPINLELLKLEMIKRLKWNTLSPLAFQDQLEKFETGYQELIISAREIMTLEEKITQYNWLFSG